MGAGESTNQHFKTRRKNSLTTQALFDAKTEFRSWKTRTSVFFGPSSDFRAAVPAQLPVLSPRIEGADLGAEAWEPGEGRGPAQPATPGPGRREGGGPAREDGGGSREGARRSRAESRAQPRAPGPAPHPEARPGVPLARATVEFSVSIV